MSICNACSNRSSASLSSAFVTIKKSTSLSRSKSPVASDPIRYAPTKFSLSAFRTPAVNVSKTTWTSGYDSFGIFFTLFALVKRGVEEQHLFRRWRLERVVPLLQQLAVYRRVFHPAPVDSLEQYVSRHCKVMQLDCSTKSTCSKAKCVPLRAPPCSPFDDHL